MISDESVDEVKSFTEKNDYNFLFVLSDKKLGGLIPAFLTTYVLSKNHNITYFKTGSFDESNMGSLVAL